ncbi:MAG: hypothetical protein JXA30_12700, partial [Deltaproteobacteria bacterium]|nr:hypothetical protein [Deltaproteobacteria bacterium]
MQRTVSAVPRAEPGQKQDTESETSRARASQGWFDGSYSGIKQPNPKVAIRIISELISILNYAYIPGGQRISWVEKSDVQNKVSSPLGGCSKLTRQDRTRARSAIASAPAGKTAAIAALWRG